MQYRYIDQTARDAQALLDNFKNLKLRDSKPFGKMYTCIYILRAMCIYIFIKKVVFNSTS